MNKVSKKIEELYFDTVSKFIVMPLGIKIITTYLFIGGLLLALIPLFPGAKFSYDEIVLTRLQTWKTGIAPITIGIGIYSLYTCNLFLKREPHAPLCLFTTIVALFLGTLGMEVIAVGQITHFAEGISGCSFMILIAMCYLYLSPNAKSWFEN